MAKLNPALCALAALTASVLFLIGAAHADAETDAVGAGAGVELMLDALAGLRDLDGLTIAPDGQHFVVLERRPDVANNEVAQIWLIGDLDSGAVRSLADGGAMMFKAQPSVPPLVSGYPDDARPFWDARGEAVYVRRRALAQGPIQLWRVDAETGALQVLTSPERDVVAVERARDGVSLLIEYAPYALGDMEQLLEDGARTGYLFDARFAAISGSSPQIPALEGHASYARFAPVSARLRTISASERAALAPLEAPPARAVARTENGRRSAWAEPADPARPGPSAPYRLRVREGRGGAFDCPASACVGRITEIWWLNASELAFLRTDGVNATRTQIWRWRPSEAQAHLVIDTQTRLRQCGPASGRELVCLADAAASPVSIVSLDLDRGVLRTRYEPNPDFPRARLAGAQRIFWRAPDGVETHGDLVLPPDHQPGERHPLVITTYLSRGFLKGATGDEYPIQAFAAAGFAVLNIHAPVHPVATQVTRDPIEAARISRQGMNGRRNALGAVIAGLAAVEALGVIDGDRIAMTGFSYGSEMTHHALLCWDRLDAAIVSGPSYDPLTYYIAGESTQRAFARMGFGNPLGPDRELIEMASFGLHAGDAGAPFLINSADREYMAALFAFTELREAGRPVELHVFPDAYHYKWRPAQRRVIYERNLDWLRFWLMNAEDPDPNKRAQYERWRALRPLAQAARAAPRGAPERCLP